GLVRLGEFGRRVDENGSRGTDHGAASCLFHVGPSVCGGVVGKHPNLKDLDVGDLKYHTDFRRVYATLLDRWLGCDSNAGLGARWEHVKELTPKGSRRSRRAFPQGGWRRLRGRGWGDVHREVAGL